jgi:hypothetical protein
MIKSGFAPDNNRRTRMTPKADLGSAYGLGNLHQLVLPIAGFGVPGSSPWQSSPSSEGDWRRLRMDIGYQRLNGIAIEAAESGWLDLTEQQWRELVDVQRDQMCGALMIEGALAAIDDAYREAGIDYVVLKGPSLAHCAYSDPSLRPFGDLDLLVRNHHWDRASQILAAVGFEPAHPEAREGFHASFGKALVHRRDDGIEVDLHRRLVVGPHGLCADPAELFSGVESFEVGGRPLPRLADTWLFVHVCMHAALGSRKPILLAVRDVLEVAKMEVDWKLVEERARKWKLRAVIPYAIQMASELLGGDPPDPCRAACDRLTPTARERRWLDAYITDRRSQGGTAIAAISAIPGLRDKTRYVTALLIPERKFLESRPRASYLRRWALPLRWLMGRRGT